MSLKLVLGGDDVLKVNFWTPSNIQNLPTFVGYTGPGSTPLKGVLPAPPSSATRHVLTHDGVWTSWETLKAEVQGGYVALTEGKISNTLLNADVLLESDKLGNGGLLTVDLVGDADGLASLDSEGFLFPAQIPPTLITHEEAAVDFMQRGQLVSFFDTPRISLMDNIAQTVDHRQRGKTPADIINIFDTKDHQNSDYVRNPECWATDLIGITALSVWNSHYGEQIGGVAVGPRHVLVSTARVVATGLAGYLPTTFRFVTRNNVVVNRTATQVTQVGSSDLSLLLLSADLPESIEKVRTLDENIFDYTDFVPGGLPIMTSDEEKKALLVDLISISGSTVTFTTALDRTDFTEVLGAGDLGNPLMVPLGNELFVISLTQADIGDDPGFGDSVLNSLSAIDTVMSGQGGGVIGRTLLAPFVMESVTTVPPVNATTPAAYMIKRINGANWKMPLFQ